MHLAGEKHDEDHAGPPVQPGGRRPAPGRLELVQAFVNSHYDLEVEHGADLLRTPAGLGRWLAGRGLIEPTAAVDDRDLRRALAAREALREVARAPGTTDRRAFDDLDRATRGAALELRFAPDGPSFVSADGGPAGAIAAILAVAGQAMLDGSWARLKICPGERCGWAFYDHSRNQAGRWCSMAVCGGRAKARAHYRRRADAS
ncbi:MAG TPA: CGNR zinc finger domain-containing protein [Solirubrobacteraceae bacterium]|jgi:predicted RNA-binding Zn ribbon-like protein|nr:CGNR zinc finger domain-containing protein [Solirubrobacteraceae bacterium]